MPSLATHSHTTQSGPAIAAGYDVSPTTILSAAKARFGESVEVSPPYWLDNEILRVGIALDDGNLSFGANFFFKDGAFH